MSEKKTLLFGFKKDVMSLKDVTEHYFQIFQRFLIN